MANTISGQLYYISPVQEIATRNGNTIQKREVWLTPMYFDRYSGQPTVGKPEESVKVEFSSERVASLDAFKQGDYVTISFDLRGRVYQKDGYDNCITSVDGRSIVAYKGATQTAHVEPTYQAQQQQQQAPMQQQQAYAQQPTAYNQPAYQNPNQQPLYGQQQMF